MVLNFVESAFTIHVDYADGYVETRFYDGSKCVGSHLQPTAADDDAYARTAHRTGYGDNVELMAVENDLLHSFVSIRAGMPFSPALWGTAHNRWWAGWAEEENWVYALQCLLHKGTLLDFHRAAIENYVKWTRPKTTVEALVEEAREWLAEVRAKS